MQVFLYLIIYVHMYVSVWAYTWSKCLTSKNKSWCQIPWHWSYRQFHVANVIAEKPAGLLKEQETLLSTETSFQFLYLFLLTSKSPPIKWKSPNVV